MKVKDLIKELEKLDQEREIMTSSYDDIMGYNPFFDPYISEETVMKYNYVKETKRGLKHLQGYEGTISNWIPDKYEKVTIYKIGD